ncbi:Poly [ADP-ribose] polymerase 4 [Camelus dromedarius]|uniref:Poly [ADP-ribose] polymerase 4 n=1 Tax=Camelus dromedarius TaxID=9838 RepID=A0A5N4D8I1_CAMDR|nr:Poly [ADP-ribose] polymerase 4 [Camelus dromedarius]
MEKLKPHDCWRGIIPLSHMQIEDQMTRMRSPSCHSVSVRWQQLSTDAPEPLQAPAQVQSLFHSDRLLVYGLIPHCTQATLCALIQEKEFSTVVSTTELQKTTGTMIHRLVARALIRDHEDGVLHEDERTHEMKKQTLKSLIIKLSKENSLVTQFTSFVAVEKRDGNESPSPDSPDILELIAQEDVDFLPYMSWQEEPRKASTSQGSISYQDGFWKLTPELGFILNLDINILISFLEKKGIRSLGVKGRERLLDLVATFLVLHFLRSRLERQGGASRSLMKLDDASVSRRIPWAFEEIRKASEWLRRTEGQYPSICWRLELGKDWDSATKQLLGMQPAGTTARPHRR